MRSYYFIGFLFLAVCFTYLLNFATQEPVSLSSTLVTQEDNYDFFMNDVDTTHFNINGDTEFRLQALRSTYYSDPDYTLFESPNMTIYQPDGLPWFASSDSGRIEKDVAMNQDKVELIDNVVLHHIDDEGMKTTIHTDSLTIYPNTKELNTDRRVLIEAPGTETTGVGMSADLRVNIIKLLADVKSRYYE